MRINLLFLSATLLFFTSAVHASKIGEELTFKRIAILKLEDASKGDYGDIINKSLKNSLMDAVRFEINAPDKIKKAPKTKNEAIKIGKGLRADAIITGSIKFEDNILKIFVEITNVMSGSLFATETKWIKEKPTNENIEKGVKELTARLISRIPYKALVTEVGEDEIIINAGRFHGVEQGTKLSIFEIKDFKRHPFTGEIVSIEKEEIGEFTAKSVEDAVTRAKVKTIKKNRVAEVGNKIEFKPSLKIIADNAQRRKEYLSRIERLPEAREVKKEEKIELEKRNWNMVGFDAFVGLANNDYTFNSNGLKFMRNANYFLTAGVKGEFWPVPFLGAEFLYRTGWISFDKIGSSNVDISAAPSWLTANLEYRHIFSSKATSPHLIVKGGYHIYDFSVNKSELTYFNNYSYRGFNIGLGAKIPFLENLGLNVNGDYQPMLTASEDPVTSGSEGKGFGYSLGIGIYYKIINGFMADLNYFYTSYKIDFNGAGTRGTGTTNASSTETSNGLNLNVRYEF
ncbi:MAG: hypothetical protein HZA06_06775 [Nitrospirae bacterium]|nr:hypothetical protein [Nitrospirota bacterium]